MSDRSFDISDNSIDVGFLPIAVTVDEICDAVEWIERGVSAQEAIELATQECVCLTVGLNTHLCGRQGSEVSDDG